MCGCTLRIARIDWLLSHVRLRPPHLRRRPATRQRRRNSSNAVAATRLSSSGGMDMDRTAVDRRGRGGKPKRPRARRSTTAGDGARVRRLLCRVYLVCCVWSGGLTLARLCRRVLVQSRRFCEHRSQVLVCIVMWLWRAHRLRLASAVQLGVARNIEHAVWWLVGRGLAQQRAATQDGRR